MSIQAQCSECGMVLEIPVQGNDLVAGKLHLHVKPCQTCLDSAAWNAIENQGETEEENQEEISRDPALFHPNGSPKSVEEACTPEGED